MWFPIVLLAIVGCCFAEEDMASAAAPRYYLFGRGNYYMATQVCKANGLRSIRINDPTKNADLTHFLEQLSAISGPFWTAGSRKYDGVTWAFDVNEPINYFNWAVGEPNNAKGNEECIEINRNGYWNDEPCSEERYVLCEEDL